MQITTADGRSFQFDSSKNGFNIATALGLPKRDTLAMTVDGIERDLAFVVDNDAAVDFITRESEAGLMLLRHDCAHVLAQAVIELYDGVQVTFGPAIANGFYYDFHREKPFTLDEFEGIEARMRAIVKRDDKFTRHLWTRDQAVEYFTAQGEAFKAEHIASIPANEDISIYQQGDWFDLCRGPHLPSTRYLGTAFKLLNVAGAHWKGQADGPKLQRIYGTCWRTDEELEAWLVHLKEVERRDHRRLGTQLGLFHTQEEAAGSVFWHAKGWTLYRLCEDYMRTRNEEYGYVEVNTPQMLDRKLWEKSGHWDKFDNNMFT
ncbi:MAG: threonine--tRNA ligase, partial [Alphaproteobacteria bacterium]|nr:threonine--tRNA ligase [Alphaproteobacteria bacterium]